MGCLRRREPIELLGALPPGRVAHVVACTPSSPRAQGGAKVAAAAAELGFAADVVDEVDGAIERALSLADDDSLVLVTGSLYVVGAARTYFRRLGSLGS
jgi:dihydrofolate synthase/folylpolyglutamate synthase